MAIEASALEARLRDALEALEAFNAIGSLGNLIVEVFEIMAEAGADGLLVLDD